MKHLPGVLERWEKVKMEKTREREREKLEIKTDMGGTDKGGRR